MQNMENILNERNNNTMSGEAALVVAARGGQLTALKQLFSPQNLPSPSQSSAALYAAARAGQYEAVKYLLKAGVNVDSGYPEPPILGALAGGHEDIAMLLLQHGADCDVKDAHGNTCFYLACCFGLVDVVKALCCAACPQYPNNLGQYPLHVAARNGHIDVIRILCFYGCKIDQKNGDGIRADITALKHGHNRIAELLDKLRVPGARDNWRRQLLHNSFRPLNRLRCVLLGARGSGKSALIESMEAGPIKALLLSGKRRATPIGSTRSRPSSPSLGAQIEMNETTRHTSWSFDSYSNVNYEPTKGIHVHQVDLAGIRDIAMWEFCGQETYFQIYHYFLSELYVPPVPLSYFSASSNVCRTNNPLFNNQAKYTAANDNVVTNIGGFCNDLLYEDSYFESDSNQSPNVLTQLSVFVILFSLELSYSVQVQQCKFWINFLMTRSAPCNRSGGLGNVVLVGSHADSSRMHCTVQGDFIYPLADKLLNEIKSTFEPAFNVYDQVFILDCNAPMSAGIRAFKAYLTMGKQNVSRTPLGCWTGFLENTLGWVINMRKSMDSFPVMNIDTFVNAIRSKVNPLASREHIDEVIFQLHIMGEIVLIGDKYIVLSAHWLTADILGTLLSTSFIKSGRATGVYGAHDMQARFGVCDAAELLKLLAEMKMCYKFDTDDDVEYEFPCYNLTETLEGLWDPYDVRFRPIETAYAGVKLQHADGLPYFITSIFPHVQVELRKKTEEWLSFQNNEDSSSYNDFDLYQWWQGSKISVTQAECIVQMKYHNGCECIEIRVRGPALTCFLLMEHVFDCINRVMERVSPGLLLLRLTLSSDQIRVHTEEPYAWSNSQIIEEMLNGSEGDSGSWPFITLLNPITGKNETLLNLLCYGSEEVANRKESGIAVDASAICQCLLMTISRLLDPPHPLGADWCMLAMRLGVNQDVIASLHSQNDTWCTSLLLKSAHCSIGTLISNLKELDRTDVATLITRFTPPYEVSRRVSTEDVFLWEVTHDRGDEECARTSGNAKQAYFDGVPSIHTEV